MTEKEFEQLTHDVADGLGYTVSECGTNSARMVNGVAEIRFVCGVFYGKSGRVRVCGLYPIIMYGPYTDGGIDPVFIIMPGTKTSEQMVKEIKRRFMPDYLVNLERAKIYKAECDAHRSGVAESLHSLAGAMDRQYKPCNKHADSGMIYGRYGVYKIDSRSANTVRMIVDTTTEKALKVIETLKGME